MMTEPSPTQQVVQPVAASAPPPALVNFDVQCIVQAVAGILQPVPRHPLKAGIQLSLTLVSVWLSYNYVLLQHYF